MRLIALCVLTVTVLLAACGGGGGKKDNNQVYPPGTLPESRAIQSINLSPSNVTTGTVAEISATYTNPGTFENSTKLWNVNGGTLSEGAPDFDLILREVAGTPGTSSSLSTAAERVYWFTPTTPGSYKVTLKVDNASLDRIVDVTSAPVYLEVVPADDDAMIVRSLGREFSDLYQGAFRILYNPSLYEPLAVQPGDLLGGEDDVLFLGLTNQVGFVPIGITRKGEVPGVNGNGVIAEALFGKRTASHAPRALAIAGFELGLHIIRDSSGEPIWGE